MTLHRLHEYVTSTVVITIGLLVAMACGKLTAGGEEKILATILMGCAAVGVALVLRNRIWILIPLSMPLVGTFQAMLIPFRFLDFVVLYVAVTFVVLSAMKVMRARTAPFERIDILVFAIMSMIAFAFIRNPVGTKTLGSSMVGGRPYFNAFIAFLIYCIFRQAPVNAYYARRIPFYIVIGSALASATALVGNYLPSIGGALGHYYSGFDPMVQDPLAAVDEGGLHRETGFLAIGGSGMLMLTAYCVPITLFLPFFPFRFVASLLFMMANLLSGFRIAVAVPMVYVLIASWFRKRYQDIVILLGIMVFGIAILALGIVPLPLSAQRALSFLPGNWNREAAQDASGSTQWRIDMWKMVLSEDKWIKNKWFGDGFGFSKYDLSIMESAAEPNGGFIGAPVQEGFMIAGAYHSGPLSTIRFVGYIGLVIFLTFLAFIAWRAYRLIIRAQRTPLFPVALFVGMPMLLKPFFYLFVFGGFDGDLPEALFSAGMIRLLEGALDEFTPGTSENPAVTPQVLSPKRPNIRRPAAPLPVH